LTLYRFKLMISSEFEVST